MRSPPRWPWVLFGLALAGCGADGGQPPSAIPSTAGSAVARPGADGPLPAPSTATPQASAANAACSPPSCRIFPSAAAAFEAALESKPRVVGIGEAHTQKAAGASATTAKRFTDEVLPIFKGRASDLLVEILMPPNGCQKETKEVRKAHEPVTQQQAASNQNDYVAMGEAARKIGVVPDLLRPTCADLAAVSAAGPDAVPRTLETIARLSVKQVEGLLARRSAEAMILLYGGAIHNDREPEPERAAWSYGKDVAARVNGRYLEIDVFSSDQIKDDETWRKLPWVARYDRAALGDKTVLLTLRPDAAVLVLPSAAP